MTTRNRHYLLDLIEEEGYLSESLLTHIEDYTRSFKDQRVSRVVKDNEIEPILNAIKDLHSYDNFHKGRVWSYLESLVSKKISLKELPKKRRDLVYQLLSSVLEKKNIGIISGSLSYEELFELSQLFQSNSILPQMIESRLSECESDEEYVSILSSYPTELIDKLVSLSDKIFSYNSILSTQSTELNSIQLNSTHSECINGEGGGGYTLTGDIHRVYTKRGGGYSSGSPLFTNIMSISMKNRENIAHLLNSLRIFIESEKVIVGSSRIILSKITDLLIHLYLSRSEEGWIPISREFIDFNKLSLLTSSKIISHKTGEINSSLYVLKDLGLVNIRNYSIEKKESRTLKLTNLALSILGVASMEISRVSTKTLELIPGELNEDTQDWEYYSGDFIPNVKLIDSVLRSFKPIKVNMNEYIEKMKLENPLLGKSVLEYKEFVLTNLTDIETGLLPIDLNSVANFYRDIDLLTSGHNIKVDKKGNRVIRTSFVLGSTGRLFARNSVQGITRVSKSYVHEGRYNYDIPNSQIRVLIEELEKVRDKFWDKFSEFEKTVCSAGLEHLIKYRDDILDKESIANSLSISVDDWKKCLYTLVFGGPLSASPETSIGSIMIKYAYTPGFKSSKLHSELEKFKKPINIWMKYCQSYYLKQELSVEQEIELLESSRVVAKSEDIVASEWCYNGVVFLKKDSEIFSDPKKLSAFILQGRESSFIYYIMIFDSSMIGTLSYEFDGIVTSKPIPEKYINYAREKSGFTTGQVLVKGFDKSLED